ncbi:DUF4345 domain-containing protein [Hoeflea sp.]|uniref:DUF4345 domain-containing protein n=1 Tax=Hoeflea sp. TaxID=1940281 RepID=UPI003B016177
MKIINNIVLALSGLALIHACTMRLINPSAAVFLQSYFETAGNTLDRHIELASEIRGLGASMLLAGVVAFLGIVKPRFRLTSFVVVSVIFVGVVLGRSISLVADGVPDASLLRPAVIEGILAALNVVCLVRTFVEERKT